MPRIGISSSLVKVLEQLEKREKNSQQADVYGPEKEAWRQDGHYFSKEEAEQLLKEGALHIELINE